MDSRVRGHLVRGASLLTALAAQNPISLPLLLLKVRNEGCLFGHKQKSAIKSLQHVHRIRAMRIRAQTYSTLCLVNQDVLRERDAASSWLEGLDIGFGLCGGASSASSKAFRLAARTPQQRLMSYSSHGWEAGSLCRPHFVRQLSKTKPGDDRSASHRIATPSRSTQPQRHTS